MAGNELPGARAKKSPGIDELHAQVRAALMNDITFVSAEFRRGRNDTAPAWETVSVRPVKLQNEVQLQFTYFDGRQTIVKNYPFHDVNAVVEDILSSGFRSMVIKETTGAWRAQISKKGRPIIHHDPNETSVPLPLTHDREKPYLIEASDPPPFLQAIGVSTQDGRIRSGQQRKVRQINEFLRLLDGTGIAREEHSRPLQLVDLGCGNATLTFAAYHYLHNMAGLPVEVTGVDIKPHLIQKHNATAQSLGWDSVSFSAGRIIDYQPSNSLDIVIALHACDTATDEALAQGIWANSKLILSAPCCHHHLQAQLADVRPPVEFEPVMRHGILRERLGDNLTDAFRAQILTILGYQTDVIEFIAVTHTPKNLLIRAIRQETTSSRREAAVASYLTMKAYWGVTPYLEELLKDRLVPLLAVK